MDILYSIQNCDSYCSVPKKPTMFSSFFPSIAGYYAILSEVVRCSYAIRTYSDKEALPIITKYIGKVVTDLENIGITFDIKGMDNTKKDTPAVIIANHMGSLETILTMLFAGGKYPVSSVSKRSVMSYPFFKDVFGKVTPLLIDRENPREDFKILMSKGKEILESGRHIVIFAQGTRTRYCKEEDFSSIGIKLARSSGFPVIPLALKTDAWHVGKYIKDIGYMQAIPVLFKFFAPIAVTSATGKEEHALCTQQICTTVNAWLDADSSEK